MTIESMLLALLRLVIAHTRFQLSDRTDFNRALLESEIERAERTANGLR
jgi:hypothetical protein